MHAQFHFTGGYVQVCLYEAHHLDRTVHRTLKLETEVYVKSANQSAKRGRRLLTFSRPWRIVKGFQSPLRTDP